MPRRRALARLSLLLLAVAGLLRLGFDAFSPTSPPARVAATPAPEALAASENDPGSPSPEERVRLKAARRALTLRAADTHPRPPADTVFSLADGSAAPRAYAVALDELYFPARPAALRLQTLDPAPDLAAHLARASTLTPIAAGPVDPATLRHSPAPRLVLYPVGQPRDAATRRIVTPGLAVTLPSADTPTPAPLPHLGIIAWERPSYAPAEAIARVAGDPAQPLRALDRLRSHPDLAAARLLLAAEHAETAVPGDRFFPRQWHLRNTGQQGAKGIDIQAVTAWDFSRGRGVVIGVVDTAFDGSHPELTPGTRHDLAHDWIGNDAHPWAADSDASSNHGTSVAGLALATFFTPGSFSPDNGVVGAAPEAAFAPLCLLGGATTEEDDAEAMTWRNDVIAVKNNSWGPYTFPYFLYPLPPLFRAALEQSTREGRDGLGTLHVFAAGNGREKSIQGAKDAYPNNRHVIAVSSLDASGKPSSFSESGPHILVTAPGSSAQGLVTTDRIEDRGYNGKYWSRGELVDTDYTNIFTGTSASAPLVSGVCALILEARPDLGWRDVKEILMRSATRVQSTDKGWTRSSTDIPGFPLKHHHRHGAGLVNARQAVALALDWRPLPPEQIRSAHTTSVTLRDATPANNYRGDTTFTLYPAHSGPSDTSAFRVEHVELTLDISHPYRGDLVIELVSPAGAVSTFVTRTYEDDSADYPDWTFSSMRHWGEILAPSTGGWKVRIIDEMPGDSGVLRSCTLTLHGSRLETPPPSAGTTTLVVPLGAPLVLGDVLPAVGTPLSGQWKRNGKLLRQGLAAPYRVAHATALDAGNYELTLANQRGETATHRFTVRIDATIPARYETYARVATEFAPPPPKLAGGVWSLQSAPLGLTIDPKSGQVSGAVVTPGSQAMDLVYTRRGVITRTTVVFTTLPAPAAVAGRYEIASTPLEITGFAPDVFACHFDVSADGVVTGSVTLGATVRSFTTTFDTLQNHRLVTRSFDAGSHPAQLEIPLDGSPAKLVLIGRNDSPVFISPPIPRPLAPDA